MAMYSDELIDDVLSATDIISLINEYVPLQRRGANYLGLCPFHKEKTPSFTVSPEKQIYKCFGCGEGGNAFSFISKLENLDFRETMELLAERANIDVERYKVGKDNLPAISRDEKEIVFNINKETAKYFYEALVEQVESPTSLLKDYLNKRKLDKTTIVRFGLGFGSKKSIGLIRHLRNLGYKDIDILKAGIVAKNQRGELYENFAGRLIFPIFDVRDRVIGFGGRVLDKSLPKYVNSPENIVYHKGKNLYALNVAKKEALPYVIITEGYMDTVALHKSGISNVVASLGTALTEGQAKLIKKYTSSVVIAYDQDNAGQTATLRAIDILSKEGLKVKVLRLNHDDVKDPDEYINKYGVENFKDCVKNSISSIEYKVIRAEEGKDLTNFDDKLEFLSKVSEILAQVENAIEQEMYLDLVTVKYNISKSVLQEEIIKRTKKTVEKNIKQERISENLVNKKINNTHNIRKRQEQLILALFLCNDKKCVREIKEKYTPGDFESEDLKAMYIRLLELSKEYDLSKINLVSKFEDTQEINLVTEILCIDISSFDKSKLMQDLEINFKKYNYLKKRTEIMQRLSEEGVDPDEKKFLEIELNQILKKIGKMKQN